jgi:tetratricopeptide (TPR) repeat protein
MRIPKTASRWPLMLRLILGGLITCCMLPGCQSFRAEVGAGLGFGAEVSLPVVIHTGFAFGSFKHAGLEYGRGLHAGREDGDWEKTLNVVFVHEITHSYEFAANVGSLYYKEHFCFGLAPLLMDSLDHQKPDHSYALEVDLYALVFSIRLGFNPWYLSDHSEAPPPNQIEAEAHFRKGNEHMTKNEAALAVAEYTKAIELAPVSAMYVNRGLAQLALERSKEALSDFNEAVRLAPGMWNGYFGRGLVHFQSGNFPLAVGEFTRAIELQGDKVEAYLARGGAYAACGLPQIALAIQDFDRAIELKPDSGEAFLRRASAWLLKGDTARSKADLERAKELGTKIPPDLSVILQTFDLNLLPAEEPDGQGPAPTPTPEGPKIPLTPLPPEGAKAPPAPEGE